ncbi:MAG: DNA topoisomerase I, partial [Muribaculaceae bacterium]|nr:DNA topoisomerase I [Muribaculaceae bacterium]
LAPITLEEARRLFAFPRALGAYAGLPVQVGVGRFGPYVRHDGKYVSIPAELPAAEVTLEQAVELIDAKRSADAQKVLRTYDEDPEIQILNGRFGPYIAYKKKNYRLPKTVGDPAAITFEQARKIIEEGDAAPAKPRRKAKK